MSVHCLICGQQANWREDEEGNAYEVDVDEKTWIVLKAFKDPLLSSTTGKSMKQLLIPGTEVWVHRDCFARWVDERGGSVRINYKPKKYLRRFKNKCKRGIKHE